jgi:hypothetical protein
VSPAFVQKATAHGTGSSMSATPAGSITTGNRLIVEIGIWNSQHATAKSVTDTAGNTYTELAHFTASEGTEQSVWTAPVTAGGGTKPTITATASSSADIGFAALEYSGMSIAAGTGAVDQLATATGTTGSSAGTVSSGATPAATSSNELALGFYADSGFGDTLTAGTSWTARASIAATSDMELMAEDQPVTTGGTPSATVTTGPGTVWLMSTIIFKHA